MLADTEDVWSESFAHSGRHYAASRLVLYSGTTRVPGGVAQGASGSFHLPSDQTVYLDFSFFDQMHRQLSMTNRLGRAIDRARRRPKGGSKWETLTKRARRIRTAILAISLAMFFAALLVLVLFLSVFMRMDVKLVVSSLFVASLASLTVSLIRLIADVLGSLKAMDAELRG